MAIGNVGTYATVEGAPVDFAKLISSNVKDYQDRQDEQEKARQAQEAAKAKAREEREKNHPSIDKFTSIANQGGASKLITDDLQQQTNDHYSLVKRFEAGDSNVSRGDLEASSARINQTIANWDAVSKSATLKANEIAKNANDYIPASLSEHSEAINDVWAPDPKTGKPNWVVNKDNTGAFVYQRVQRDSEGNVTKILDEKKTPQEVEAIASPVKKFDVEKNVADFVKSVPLNSTANYIGTMKITEETIAKDPKIGGAIAEKVSSDLKDPHTLAALNYQRTGKWNNNVTDPKEIEDTTKMYHDRLVSGYKEIIDKTQHFAAEKITKEPTQGITTLNPEGLDNSAQAVGNAYQLKKPVVFPSIAGKHGNYTNLAVNKFNWDKNGNFVMHGSYETVKTSRMSPQDSANAKILNAFMINGSGLNAEQQDQMNSLINTYGSTKVQKTIVSKGDVLAADVAAALKYKSVDDFRNATKPKVATTSSNKSNAQNETNSSGTVQVSLSNGRTGSVPKSQLANFLRDNKGSKKI